MTDDVGYGALLFRDPHAFWTDDADRRAVLGLEDGTLRNLPDWKTGLPDNCVVWSNAGFKPMRDAHLLHDRYIREDRYPMTTLSGVLGELGMAEADVADQAMTLARIWGNAMRLCRRAFEVAAVPQARNLALAIRGASFGDGNREACTDAIGQAMLAAAQGYVSVRPARKVRGDGARYHALRRHRQQHAAEILSTPVPRGAWVPSPLPADRDKRLEYVLDTVRDKPLLVRANVVFHGPQARAKQALFGSHEGAAPFTLSDLGAASADERGWFCANELAVLAGHAEIEVVGALQADGYQDNPASRLAPVVCGPLPKAGDDTPAPVLRVGPLLLRGIDTISYSVGLVCESAWCALTRTPVARTPDAVAMWLTAADRAICMRFALDLMAMALPVEITGYSRGRLWIKIHGDVSDDEAENMLALVASRLNLIPPVLSPAQIGSPRLGIARAVRRQGGVIAPDGKERIDSARMEAALAILGRRVLLKELTR